jgi:hypothetical protein
MRLATLGCAALLALGLAGRPAQAAPAVTGDYIEARSCNLYVGACHAQGEFTTAGRQAILAWKVGEGTLDGISLKGLSAIALVTSDRNLGAPGAERRSVLYVDASATAAQREALTRLIKERAGESLGTVLAVHEAKIAFDQSGELYQVSAAGVATLKAKKEPARLCCIQKYEVWYQPFVTLADGKIGYGVLSEFRDPTLQTTWSGSDQNNTYFGKFSF